MPGRVMAACPRIAWCPSPSELGPAARLRNHQTILVPNRATKGRRSLASQPPWPHCYPPIRGCRRATEEEEEAEGEHSETMLMRDASMLVLEKYDLLQGGTSVTQSTANLSTTIIGRSDIMADSGPVS